MPQLAGSRASRVLSGGWAWGESVHRPLHKQDLGENSSGEVPSTDA